MDVLAFWAVYAVSALSGSIISAARNSTAPAGASGTHQHHVGVSSFANLAWLEAVQLSRCSCHNAWLRVTSKHGIVLRYTYTSTLLSCQQDLASEHRSIPEACKGPTCIAFAEHVATESNTCNGPLAAASLGIRGALLVYFLRHKPLRPRGLSEKAATLGGIGFELVWNLGLGLTSPYVNNWCAYMVDHMNHKLRD